jgi:S-DNA-T family DNA segregation ATPase FtsK/SpoIIIE
MPHLLVAGATGQGKSVGINTILVSLLYKKHPSQVKLVLIDPKKVELFPYSKLDNHFLAFLPNQDEPIITDTTKVIHTLNSLCIEMDNRYDLLKKASARNIREYNDKFVQRRLNPQKGHKFLPFIVLVIDEFADLIMTAGKEVELPIGRLAQLARAVGIHLVIATQRPSVNIITGVIKANFPARIGYKVTSKVDSRTILDAGGAEQLIGRGDMLLSVGGEMVRLQGAFIDTPEVEQAIDFIAKQPGYPEPYFLPEYYGDDEPPGPTDLKYSDLDEMFEDSARLIVQSQHGSTSMIQRRLKLGYNRAGRIMDQLEAMGIVGPSEGSKAREVLIYDEGELERYLADLRARK